MFDIGYLQDADTFVDCVLGGFDHWPAGQWNSLSVTVTPFVTCGELWRTAWQMSCRQLAYVTEWHTSYRMLPFTWQVFVVQTHSPGLSVLDGFPTTRKSWVTPQLPAPPAARARRRRVVVPVWPIYHLPHPPRCHFYPIRLYVISIPPTEMSFLPHTPRCPIYPHTPRCLSSGWDTREAVDSPYMGCSLSSLKTLMRSVQQYTVTLHLQTQKNELHGQYGRSQTFRTDPIKF